MRKLLAEVHEDVVDRSCSNQKLQEIWGWYAEDLKKQKDTAALEKDNGGGGGGSGGGGSGEPPAAKKGKADSIADSKAIARGLLEEVVKIDEGTMLARARQHRQKEHSSRNLGRQAICCSNGHVPEPGFG